MRMMRLQIIELSLLGLCAQNTRLKNDSAAILISAKSRIWSICRANMSFSHKMVDGAVYVGGPGGEGYPKARLATPVQESTLGLY